VIQLRPHQQAAADAVEDAFRAGINRPLIDMCVGAGKSLTFAELARREIARGGRVIISAHTRELVEQNAAACRSLGLETRINAAALGERAWRAPVISAAVQSIYRNAQSFGPISLLGVDEAHLLPHSESGMYRELIRGLGGPGRVRVVGGSGTVFRLQGGSLVEGEGAPFDQVVYRYSILDGIRDGYLVPAFSAGATDKIDASKLRIRQGEYTGDSQDVQMIAAMDNHIAQMVHHGSERRAWLVFEASVKAAHAMTTRMNEWGIPTGLVLGETPPAVRRETIEAFRSGRLRALVNRDTLTTGFDVQQVDMLVMRRRTQSLGLYLQMTGRLLRTIGGNIAHSVAAGKADGLVLDFAGNIDLHGPLDFIRPKESKARLVSCETCGIRNAAAAVRCWSCDAPMEKLCPRCLEGMQKGLVDCPHCGYDMRVGPAEGRVGETLLKVPSGAALIASWGKVAEKEGGWLPITKAWDAAGEAWVQAGDGPVRLPAALAAFARDARWVRAREDGEAAALLLMNGANRTSARQITAEGGDMIVPMPAGRVETGALPSGWK